MDEAVGVREGHDLPAHRHSLLGGELRDVARTGDGHHFAADGIAPGAQHFFDKIDQAIARGLLANAATAPIDALASEHASELIPQLLVLTVQEADLAPSHADIARRHVGVRPDVAVELAHECLAEPHNLLVALAFRVKVGAAFAAAHREGGERVLEHLLEGQKLERAKGHRRVKTQPAFVGPDGAVHLHAVAAVDLHLAVAVGPGDAEHDDALRLGHALEDFGLLIFGVLLYERPHRFGDFGHGLMEFRFRGITLLECGQERGQLIRHTCLGGCVRTRPLKGVCGSHGTDTYHPTSVAFKSQRSRPPLAGASDAVASS